MPERTSTAGSDEAVRLKLTPAARTAIAAALAGRADGAGVRVWVERGMRPHAQMMIDRASPRDLPVTIDGQLLLIDRASLAFLRDAEIRYHATESPPGFEVVGPFLPARPVAGAPAAPADGGTRRGKARPDLEEKVRAALRNIYDPEIPMNIVDLGLVYDLLWDDAGALTVRMTMTSPGCPSIEELVREVERSARTATGAEVRVEVVWDPPWSPERMTDFARRQFGYA